PPRVYSPLSARPAKCTQLEDQRQIRVERRGNGTRGENLLTSSNPLFSFADTLATCLLRVPLWWRMRHSLPYLLRGDDRQNSSKYLSAEIRQLPRPNPSICERHEASNFEKSPFGEHGSDLSLSIMSHWQRITFSPFPLPKCRSD